MEYCKRLRISSLECAILTQSALYLTFECALIGTRTSSMLVLHSTVPDRVLVDYVGILH
jgi:hypothetical protein